MAIKSLLALYEITYRVVRCKKPHIIAEELILPAVVDMVLIMIGGFVAKKKTKKKHDQL